MALANSLPRPWNLNLLYLLQVIFPISSELFAILPNHSAWSVTLPIDPGPFESFPLLLIIQVSIELIALHLKLSKKNMQMIKNSHLNVILVEDNGSMAMWFAIFDVSCVISELELQTVVLLWI